MSEKSWVGLTQCFYCGEASDILLDTRMRDTFPPGMAVYNMRPCSACEEHMKAGIILISVKVGEMEKVKQEEAYYRRHHDSFAGFCPNPFRSGGWWVIKEEALRRLVHPAELADHIAKLRWSFIPDDAAEKMGLIPGSTETQGDKEDVSRDASDSQCEPEGAACPVDGT